MRNLVTLFLSLIWVGSMYAQEWPVARGDSREPNPYKYDPKILEQIPKDFLNDAPAVYLHVSACYRVEADNTQEITIHEVVRINSRKAIDQLGEHRSIVFAPAYEKVTLHLARVHKPNGQIIEVEPKHVQLRDVGTDFLIYTTDKQVILSLPSVDVKDVIEVKWTSRGKHPEYGEYFFQRYYFGDEHYPIVSDQLSVVLPEKKKLTYAAINAQKARAEQFSPKQTQTKEGVLYEWKWTNLPQVTQYERAPSRELNRPGIAMSTMTDWEQVAEWKRKTRVNCWECTAELKELVAELTKGLKTETEKTAALATWVKNNIRYISAGEKHDYIPHPPALIVKNRFGDCKDTSQLLAVLLKEAKINSSLVTLGVKDDGQVMEEVPSPWGTHAILLVQADGKEHWVDSTVNLGAWNLLPEAVSDRVCYVLSEKGISIRRTPKLTSEQCQIIQKTIVDLNYEGTSTNHRTMKYLGLAAYSRRDDWYGVPSGERRRSYTSELQDAAPRSRLVSLDIDEKILADINQPVEAKSTFQIFGHVSGSPAEGSVTDSPVWARILSVSVDMARTTPIDLSVPFYSEHTYQIQLPPGRRFAQNIRSVHSKSLWGTFSREVVQNERSLTIVFKTRLNNSVVQPKDFEDFSIWQDEISNGYRVYFEVRPLNKEDDPKRISADIQTLQGLLKKDPKDRKAAIELINLFMLLNQSQEAAQVIDQILKFYPKDIEILKLAALTSQEPKRVHRFYGELLQEKPDDWQLRLDYVAALMAQKDTAKVKAILAPIFTSRDHKSKIEAHLLLAQVALMDRDFPFAEKSLEEAKKLDPELIDDPQYLQVQGQLWFAEKKFEQAARILARAIDPENPSAGWKEVVTAWFLSGRVPETLAALAEWMPHLTEPDDLSQAAGYYLKFKRYTEAKHLAERIPGPSGKKLLHRLQGLEAIENKQYPDAIKGFTQLPFSELTLEEQSQLILAYIRTGGLNSLNDLLAKEKLPPREETIGRQLFRRHKAIEGYFEKNDKSVGDLVCAEFLIRTQTDPVVGEFLLGQVLAKQPKNGLALALRAWLNLEKGRLRQALPDAEAAVNSIPNDFFCHLVRGRIRFEREGVIEDLTKAVELSNSKDAQVLYWLAYAYFELGKIAEAKATIAKAVSLAKEDAMIQTLSTQINGAK